jgi:hypothetical protein
MMNNKTTYWADGVTLAETIEDNGDNTAAVTTYDESGQVTSTEVIVWDSNASQDSTPVVIQQSAIDQLATALADPSVNTVLEIKTALKNFVDSI